MEHAPLNTWQQHAKTKEISFKIIHKYYPANHYLIKLKKDIDVNCSFCAVLPETVCHLFWHCPYVKRLWQDICVFVIDHIYADFSLYWKDILFGVSNYDRNKKSEFYIINLIILLAKFYIHKCKFTKNKPIYLVFEKELKIYINSIKDSSNKKALKTINSLLVII